MDASNKQGSRALLRQVASFGAGEGLARALNWGLMALLPVLLNSTAEYGKVGLLVSMEMLVTNVSLLGMDRAVLRFYAKDESQGRLLMAVLSIWASCAWIPFAAAFAMFVAGKETFFSVPVAPHLLILGVFVALYNLTFLCVCIGRAKHSVAAFLRFRLVYSALKFISVLFLAAWLGSSLSYIAGIGLSALAMMLFAVPFLQGRAKGPVDTAVAFRLLLFGWPFIFHIVSGNILSQFSRFFLEAYNSAEEVGVFTLAYNLGGALYICYACLGAYFEPRVYSCADDIPHSERWLALYTDACLVLATGGAAVVLAIFPYMAAYLYTDYGHALPIVSMVMGAILLNPLYLQGNYRLTTHKRTGYIALASVVSAGLILVLNFLLIPTYGIWGAALAMFLATLLLCALVLLISIRVAGVPLRHLSCISSLLLCPVAATATVIWAYNTAISIPVLLAICLISLGRLARSRPDGVGLR